MPGYISNVCGDNTQIAMTAFANVCKEAGVKVGMYSWVSFCSYTSNTPALRHYTRHNTYKTPSGFSTALL
jgi:hypothetical protein